MTVAKNNISFEISTIRERDVKFDRIIYFVNYSRKCITYTVCVKIMLKLFFYQKSEASLKLTYHGFTFIGETANISKI